LNTLTTTPALVSLIAAAAALIASDRPSTPPPDLRAPGEKRLKNIRQLTFGGENAEAYFSSDGKKLIFQSTRDGYPADQIYVINTDGSGLRRVSNGQGRCTCAYFLQGDRRILYASTHMADPAPPPPPDRSQGYVWAIYPGYDIFTARPDGSDVRRITTAPGYDAEATVSPNGRRIVFTSMRDGDLELYTMDPDGRNVRRLTHTVGYDGGAFFSPDGRKLCFRAHRPKSVSEIQEYQELLRQDLIRPSRLELFVMNADGTHQRQVTNNRAANFCPFFTPDGRRLIFSSNLGDPRGREFDLYLVGLDGKGLERVTTSPQFDGFPMFSPDGKSLVWASNRNAKTPGETNLFIADWIDLSTP
jgi:TolB protein